MKAAASQSSLKALFSKAPPKKTAVKKESVAKPALPEAKDDADLFDEEEEEDVIAVPLMTGTEE